MKVLKTLKSIGVSVIIGVLIFTSCNAKTTEMNKTINEKRNLKLTVMSGFDGEQKTISENATSEIIKNTMHSINWKI